MTQDSSEVNISRPSRLKTKGESYRDACSKNLAETGREGASQLETEEAGVGREGLGRGGGA